MKNYRIKVLELVDMIEKNGWDIEYFKKQIDKTPDDILYLDLKDFAVEKGIIENNEILKNESD